MFHDLKSKLNYGIWKKENQNYKREIRGRGRINMTKKRIRNRKDKQDGENQMVKVGQNILNLKGMQQLETLKQYLTF